MKVLINQTRLVPVYVDIVKTRAPRQAVTDLSIIIRGIHGELSRSRRKVTIRVRHRDKRRNYTLTVSSIFSELESKKVGGVIKISKRLRSRYTLFEYNVDRVHKRGFLYVVLDKESLFLTADQIILRLEQPVIKLSDVLEGYQAVGLIVEQQIRHIPSKNLIESINKEVFVMNLDIPTIAYLPFRYTI